MSTQAQGAVGAETKTTPCGGCGAKSDAERCIGCLHDFGDEASAWLRKAGPKAPMFPLAIPRTDSDERTAGEGPGWYCQYNRCRIQKLTECGSDASCACYEATPAPSSPGVPDSVPPMPPTVDRRPLEDGEPDGYLESDKSWSENNSEAVEWLADNHAAIRTLLSTHPAGQSAGQGAEDEGWRLVQMVPLTPALMTQEIRAAAKQANDAGCQIILTKVVQPAPDSTRTGQVGTEEDVEKMAWIILANLRTDVPVAKVRQKLDEEQSGRFGLGRSWTRALDTARRQAKAVFAARPAAPEAQGAWRPIETAPKDGTEFAAYENGDVYKCHWKGYDDGEGRWSEGWFDHVNESLENPTHWCSLENLPVPPSSGQGGR